MALVQDRLITGDISGVIYIWNLSADEPSLKTFDLHKDHGAVTNLVMVARPLSLFGLTANMLGYEPGEIKSLQKSVAPLTGALQLNLPSFFS